MSSYLYNRTLATVTVLSYSKKLFIFFFSFLACGPEKRGIIVWQGAVSLG